MRQKSILMALAIAVLVMVNACKEDKVMPEQANGPKIPDSVKTEMEAETESEDEEASEDVSEQETDASVDDEPVRYYPTACEDKTVTLFAGQHTEAGQLAISNDQHYLYVTFSTTDGWEMPQTHLYVGTKEGVPSTELGNPKIGNFPYGSAHDPATTSETIRIARADLPADDCIIIAAHAEVVQYDANGEVTRGETAWSAGEQLAEGGSWATYTDYCLCESTGGIGGN